MTEQGQSESGYGSGSLNEGRPTTPLGEEAKTAAANVISKIGDDPGDIAHQIREEGSRLLGQASDRAKEMASGGKETLADKLKQAADITRKTADQLNDQQFGGAANLIHHAADRIEGFAEDFRKQDIGDLIAMATDYTRRNPSAVFLGAIAVGFLLTRFVKSSAAGGSSIGYRPPSAGASPVRDQAVHEEPMEAYHASAE